MRRLRRRQADLAGVSAAGPPASGWILAEPIRFGNGRDDMQEFPLILPGRAMRLRCTDVPTVRVSVPAIRASGRGGSAG